MKKTFRGFGLAFLLIGAFIAIVHHFQLTIPYISLSGEDLSVKKYEEQITNLEAELQGANEQITQLKQQITPNSADAEKEVRTEKNIEEENDEAFDYGTLQIYSGITPYTVGQKLEDLGIVENGVEVEMYLARPEYSRSIQVGEFELHSGMSIEEIAKIITGKVKKSE